MGVDEEAVFAYISYVDVIVVVVVKVGWVDSTKEKMRCEVYRSHVRCSSPSHVIEDPKKCPAESLKSETPPETLRGLVLSCFQTVLTSYNNRAKTPAGPVRACHLQVFALSTISEDGKHRFDSRRGGAAP